MSSVQQVGKSPHAAVRRAGAVPSARIASSQVRHGHETAFVAETAVLGKMSVRQRFATLEERFIPSKAKGVNASFQFDLSGADGGQWYVVIKDSKISVKQGTGPSPTATLRASAEDYLKIANGEMNKMWAYIRGKLKVEGDKDALKAFDTYFKDPG